MSDDRESPSPPPRREPPRLPSRSNRDRATDSTNAESNSQSLSRPIASDSRDARRSYSRSESRSEPSDYSRSYSPPSGRGTVPPTPPAKKRGITPSSLTIVALVALVAFFGGFASRNFLADRGYDDERVIKAQDVPEIFRKFCVDYNGYPSFTVLELTSVSALTMATVPILRLDTCTIPVNQTANALQALGVERRSATIGPQLGGSNLTLINAGLGQSLAQGLISRFPNLVNNGDPNTTAATVEQAIYEVVTANVDGLGLQNLIKTNINNVYVMVPGHSFNLQPKFTNGQQ